MAENTKIEWADHTFNPWLGCTKVSPACDNCYAESWSQRFHGPIWGAGQPRRRTSPQTWRQPIKWDDYARQHGVRHRVFCASLADVFDAEVSQQWRHDLFAMIRQTPNLDWLLLTKRPKLMAEYAAMFPLPVNVWAGTTVENQSMAELRIPYLLQTKATVRFLSCEPLLGPIDFNALSDDVENLNALSGLRENPFGAIVTRRMGSKIDWVIAGGESGPNARPSHPDWFRSLRDQCEAAGTAFHFKQWGEFRYIEGKGGPDDLGWDKIGKAAAGRVLDGRTWDGVPHVQA